jgi:hypothetical protein
VYSIDTSHSHILERLSLVSTQWLTLTTEFEKHFCYVVGAAQLMNAFKRHTHPLRIRGMGKAKMLRKQA